MPCKYGEHVISCGHGGGFTLGTGKLKHVHVWESYWHMGYIIGRKCTTCCYLQHMSRKWCHAQQAKAEAKS